MEDIHDEAVEYMTMSGPQVFQTIQDNEFNVVVRLLDHDVDECRSRRWSEVCINVRRIISKSNRPFTAAAFCVKLVSVVAASYFTAYDGALSNSKIMRIHLA